MSGKQKMAESHKRGKERKNGQRPRKRKEKYIRPKAYQKRERKKAQSA